MTVRNATGEVVEFTYGSDGLDPSYMEGKDRPVDLSRVLADVKAHCQDRYVPMSTSNRGSQSPIVFFSFKRYNKMTK